MKNYSGDIDPDPDLENDLENANENVNDRAIAVNENDSELENENENDEEVVLHIIYYNIRYVSHIDRWTEAGEVHPRALSPGPNTRWWLDGGSMVARW